MIMRNEPPGKVFVDLRPLSVQPKVTLLDENQ